jgi:hypothetical protein
MRIRSIKPEFWTSEDIAALDWPTRLLFVGLWSYVDDSGVGRDSDKLIKAALFPLEEDPRETLATVSRGLQNLSEGGQITRYTVDGKPFLYVNAWESHQRIDKPNKARYPAPTCENAVIRDTLATSSRDTRETPAPGAGEQRSRGTGEQGTLATAPPPRALAIPDAPTSQTLVAEWIEHCPEKPPSRVIGHIAKEVKVMLDDGIAYERVRRGLAEWNSKNLHPSTLPSIVHGLANRAPTKARGQQATDDIFERAMERAIAREAGQ